MFTENWIKTLCVLIYAVHCMCRYMRERNNKLAEYSFVLFYYNFYF